MRDLLEVNGIYVGKGSGSKIAESLHRVVTRHMCDDDDDDDDDGEIEKLKEPKMDMHFNEQATIRRKQAELANMKAELKAAQEFAAKLEATHLDNSRSRHVCASVVPLRAAIPTEIIKGILDYDSIPRHKNYSRNY
ncbi:hypothetical protein E4U32_003444 [Claviceps aff. humidiphila group G2b]|nr:hypothetical protein E4U32_003444 [Claviceps aff. humidiphila group G2b]